MEIKNIEKAKELIPQLEALGKAKALLSEPDTYISIVGRNGQAELPHSLAYNVQHVVNCEYERVRKEVVEL